MVSVADLLRPLLDPVNVADVFEVTRVPRTYAD